MPQSLLLAAPQPFEDLCFNDSKEVELTDVENVEAADVEKATLCFEASRGAVLEGYYAYMRFQAADGHAWVDSYTGSSEGQSTSWQVLFLPLSKPMLVSAAQKLTVACEVRGGRSRAPSYSFQLGAADAEPTTLSLGEPYPLDGGLWCRACAGTTGAVSEEGREWALCSGCGDAYHRRCRWDAPTPGSSARVPCTSTWLCEACML